MKTTSLKSVLFVLALALSVPVPSHAGLDIFEPSKVLEKIRKQIAKQDIGATIGLSADIIDGLSVSLKYKAKSEPSYLDGYYTRLDKYIMTTNVNVGDLLNGDITPFGFDVEQGTEVYFARQFKSQGDSIKALPYTLDRIPFTAQKAVQKLKVGDFVALQGKLNIVFSIGADTDLNPTVSLGGSTHIYMSGDFMIHLYRMENDKIRVKLITLRSRGTGASASIDYLGRLKVVGLRVVDRKLERWIDLKPASLNFGKSLNDVFMLDYVFDLKNPAAATAFNNFMSKKVKFKNLKVIDPTASRPELQNELLTDMSEVEDMYMEDHNLPVDQRRIDRVFKGSNTSVDIMSRYKLSMSILRLEANTMYSQNKLQNYDSNNIEKQYILDTYQKSAQSKIFYGIWGNKITEGDHIIFNSNPQWTPGSLVTTSHFYEARMRNVSKKDFGKMQNRAEDVLPEWIYRQIDWKHWDFSNGDIVNGYFRHQVCISPEAYEAIPRYSASQIEKMFSAYLDSQDQDLDQLRHKKIEKIAVNLAYLLQPVMTDKARYEAFRNLQKIAMWRDHGAYFILTLLPENRFEELVTYEMTFSGRKSDQINFRFGNFEKQQLYQTLLYIQNLINDRSFDLRLVTDSTGGKTKP
ncbi:hypothetical protein DOM22_17870 [Bdellovibrio sp. ZAP7]|uniref:hypothetical protein n=1 Tax=Bdellovibrio sp. ZAP7 TaxID=2231053 RepID=UPI00115BADCB|nr:hypothetical protein [Bdellovibrio sp. ZAP7]QDK46888.1 hypothetical protein DOM22_17870 [Bdellovibrio sp. ZAP7]